MEVERNTATRKKSRTFLQKNGAVVDLYAQWSRDTYKITYKTNGGELADGTAKKYNVDTRTFKLKTPVRYGYTFKGWYKDKNAPDVSHRSKKVQLKSDLYAKWQINKYKIKYDGNGATSGSMKGVSVCQYGKTYTLTKINSSARVMCLRAGIQRKTAKVIFMKTERISVISQRKKR